MESEGYSTLHSLYWNEIRDGLFVHNEEWNKTIERLPGLLSATDTLSHLVTVDQLLNSGLRGSGSVGRQVVETPFPDPRILSECIPLIPGTFPIGNLFLQWVYQFVILESITSHNSTIPLPQWNPTFVQLVEDKLHVMTYIAALMYLYEEGELKDIVLKDNFHSTEIQVKKVVSEITSTLYSKCADYGESFRRHGVQGLIPRLWDKVARYAQLSASGKPATYEPKKDSIRDLLGYCIIAWSLIHELDDIE